ncbi:NRDE family protein [Microbacterium sp. NE2HP2]|uniref:NRDE family protein n=1 Tax=Microbacterium TaxID=33882 RepID=UPI0023664BE7|nr:MULTISPECIES: NRDE family protein [Microbacterium]MDD7944895.1 NRDE family protein [Microbacterium plantarum]WHE35297.1 NRDE family protein [Microbacterium sp. BDGP8]
MCTVVIQVPADPSRPVRLLAVRDEDPSRAWDPIGPWWPDTHADVVGVRDRRAGGAWLAADPAARRLAVILNRADVLPDGAPALSRGGIVLDAVAGSPPTGAPPTHGFNLVDVSPGGVRVSMWDAATLRTVDLRPGTHMIAHDDVDDPRTARIRRWLGEFAAAAPELDRADGLQPWLDVLQDTAATPATDDAAIIRDNRPYGVPTLSLLVCTASVGTGGVDLAYGALDVPGEWNRPEMA